MFEICLTLNSLTQHLSHNIRVPFSILTQHSARSVAWVWIHYSVHSGATEEKSFVFHPTQETREKPTTAHCWSPVMKIFIVKHFSKKKSSLSTSI